MIQYRKIEKRNHKGAVVMVMTIPSNTKDQVNQTHEEPEEFSQAGKSYQDMLQYLLSGEADDLSIGLNDDILD